jgi:2-amino-1-hydroxyethylphosphonate dioxygenase (glycine-forming)
LFSSSKNDPKMNPSKADQIAKEIINLYIAYGEAEYAGEKISQTEHMVQAAQLARAQGYDDEVVLAAFLHDIGHIAEKQSDTNSMGEFGIKDHEAHGAEFLSRYGFSKRLTRLVASHVIAKRYLTLREPGYFDKLSEASKRTLVYQGGPLSDAEADLMERDPLFQEIIQMRRWDEEAKQEHQPMPPLSVFKQLIFQHLLAQTE